MLQDCIDHLDFTNGLQLLLDQEIIDNNDPCQQEHTMKAATIVFNNLGEHCFDDIQNVSSLKLFSAYKNLNSLCTES